MISKGFNLVTVGSDKDIYAGAKSDLEKLKGIKKGSKSKGY